MVQPKQLAAQEIQAIASLLRAIDPFFQMSPTIGARSVQTFLLVAASEGANVQEYARQAQIPASTMSRNLLDIGDYNRKGSPGFGLVSGRKHLGNRRQMEYHLTEKGRGLVRKITRKHAEGE